MEKISIRQSNKGFTLVEICVVLLLITILATITTLSLINWQEYSINKKMDDNAELIYMAAKNKIAQLKSDNTFDSLKIGVSRIPVYHIPINIILSAAIMLRRQYIIFCVIKMIILHILKAT